MHVILGSQSPRRKKLLSKLVSDFEIIPANINEEVFTALARSPEELVMGISKAKAKKILAILIAKQKINKKTIIITADTAVILPLDKDLWQQIGKPKNRQDAKETLKKLRGRDHYVYTGICMIHPFSKHTITKYDSSRVIFKNFDDKKLEEYLNKENYRDKAGSYGLQDLDDNYIQGYEGELSTILGLPLNITANLLEKFGVSLLK